MNIFKNKGLKKINILGNRFVIKKLSPLDFIDTENTDDKGKGIPITLFKLDKPKDVADSIMGDIQTDEQKKKERKEQMTTMKIVCLAGIVKMPYPVGLVLDPEFLVDKESLINFFFEKENIQIGICLYGVILSNSLSIFIRPQTLRYAQLLYWGSMASKFGKLPIECLKPTGGYTDVDAYIFNSFVLNALNEDQNRKTRKTNAATEKRNKGKGK